MYRLRTTKSSTWSCCRRCRRCRIQSSFSVGEDQRLLILLKATRTLQLIVFQAKRCNIVLLCVYSEMSSSTQLTAKDMLHQSYILSGWWSGLLVASQWLSRRHTGSPDRPVDGDVCQTWSACIFMCMPYIFGQYHVHLVTNYAQECALSLCEFTKLSYCVPVL